MTTPATEPRDRLPAWLLIVAIAVALVARLSFLASPFVNDPGLYAAMGKTVVEGRQLYVDLWDTKLPGVTLLTAPLYALLGDHWWAWVALQILAMGAAVWALSDAAARVARPERWAFAATATAIVGLAAINLHPLLVTGFQLETPMLACSSLAAWAMVRAYASPGGKTSGRWSMLAGAFAGMAATLKPNALAVAVAGAAGLIVLARAGDVRRAIRSLAGLAAGVAALVAVNLAWFSYLRVWPFLPEVFDEIRLYSSSTPWSQILTIKTLAIVGIVIWPAIVLALAARLRAATDVQPDETPAPRAAFVAALAWLAFEIAGTILQKRGYAYHFLPIAAPATLVAGLFAGRLSVRRAGAIAALAAAPILLWSLATGVETWRATMAGRNSWPRQLVAYLREHTQPTDAIFGDPVGELSVLADRPVGARVGMLVSFVNHDAAPAKFSRWLIDDLTARRCEIICLPIPSELEKRIRNWETQPVLARDPERLADYRAAWRRYVDFVHQNYRLETTLDGREVWRRKPDAGSQPAAAATRP